MAATARPTSNTGLSTANSNPLMIVFNNSSGQKITCSTTRSGSSTSQSTNFKGGQQDHHDRENHDGDASQESQLYHVTFLQTPRCRRLWRIYAQYVCEVPGSTRGRRPAAIPS